MGGRYKAYPEYKDSGVEWVGAVPEDWEIVPLFGVAFTESEKNSFNDETNVLSLSYGRIIQRNIEDNFGLLPESFSTYQIVNPDDVILRLTDLQNDKRSLRVGLSLERGIITAAYLKLVAKPEKMSGAFLYRLLHSYDTTKVFYGMGGGLRQSMKYEDMRRLPLLIPSLIDQEKIANFLDHETAKIDTLIEKQQQLIQLLKEKRQAVISHAVTKGLNRNAKMRDSGVEWLGEVPEHWEVTKLGHYAKVLTGFPFPSASFSHTDTDMKLIRGANVGVGVLKWNDTVYWQFREGQGLSSYLMKERQIVLGMDRPWISEGMRIARVREEDMPCLLLQRVAAITPMTRLDDGYIFSLLSSELFKAYVEPDMTGVSVPHISPEQILGFQIPLPPTEEQRLIAIHIKAQCELIQELLEFSNSSIELLQERRTALISAAVTGKIDVRDWVPPAPDHRNEEAA